MNGAVWVPILTAPTVGEPPYDWNSKHKGQCVWGTYYRVMKNGWSPPCYYDRATKVPGYTNGVDWMENYREPWVPISVDDQPNYVPVPGDILCFDGNYGHVAVIEETKIADELYIISDWNRVAPETFGVTEWKKGDTLTRTGKLMGYLHYSPSIEEYVTPVERNTDVNQIKANDSSLRVRKGPGLDADICCFITPGYYNVLSITAATVKDIALTPGLSSWYEIEKGKYCANITTEYLPKSGDADISKLLNELNDAFVNLQTENSMYKERIDKAIKILSGEDI